MRLRWICVLALATACTPQSAAENGVTTELIITSTPLLLTPEATLTATVEPTPVEPLRLVVWWPEPLAPRNDDEASAVLSSQISEFEISQPDADVEIRLKQAQDVGGILETLRTASAVAPGALPDLTLIQREDLLAAAQMGLAQPLEGRVSSAVLGDLPSSVLELGLVGGQLYGLPYVIEAQHVAYRSARNNLSWRFDAVLAREVPLVFPANRVSGVNDVFLVQYLAAGGTLPEGDVMTINRDALLDTLTFYEEAVDAGVVDPAVLDYSSPDNYAHDLASGAISAGVVTSSQYLEMLADGQSLDYGPIPTATGRPATMLNGWMWVLTTPEADRQELALAFLTWMLAAERQDQYSETIHVVPSQRAALRRWGDAAYAAFVNELLDDTTLPLTESQAGPAARALQNAFTAVVLGARTAEAATQDVMDQLNG